MNMTKRVKIAFTAAVLMAAGTVLAGPGHHRHHHRDRDGLDLAAGIVNLVMSVVAPPQVIAVEPAPVTNQVIRYEYPAPPVVYREYTVPAPVVHYRYAPPPRPVYHYRRPAPPPPRRDNNRYHHRPGHRNNGHRPGPPRR